MPLTDIVVADEPDSKRVFEGWKSVPQHYRTRAKWERDFRTVKKKEKADAVVLVTFTRKSNTLGNEFEVERRFKLYHESQTRPVRKTPLNMARRDFFRYFVEPADRSRLIRWTKGEYRIDEDGESSWDSDADVWGWRTFKESVGLQNVIDHTTGKDIYGIFGAKTSCYLLIDLDLHKQPLDLFLRRLEVLLDTFHGIQGDCRCHFQVSDRNAGGIHIILFFGVKSSLKSRMKWIRRQFDDLDRAHPDCEFFKKGRKKGTPNIEIYPGSNAHRLPLARDRTMLLDKPLQMLEHRKKRVQDIAGYIMWLDNPNRSYMSKNDVLWFILDRLDLPSAKWRKKPGEKQRASQKTSVIGQAEKTATIGQKNSERREASLKGRTREAIVGFWDKGEEGHFPHLNRAVLITLNCLHAEGITREDAVALVMQYVEELPNEELSSRLGSGTALIEGDTARDAQKIWEAPINGKLRKSIEHWQRHGFNVSDKTTWGVRASNLGVTVDCEEIQFTTAERQQLIDAVVPLLVGKKQALKSEKQSEVFKAIAYLLRYVKCCDREIPKDALPRILSSFDLKLESHNKQQLFNMLVNMGWLYIRSEYYHRCKHGGIGDGRATAYGIGEAMVHKFSFFTPKNNNRSYILSPTFREATAFDGELPSFEDQADKILADAGHLRDLHG